MKTHHLLITFFALSMLVACSPKLVIDGNTAYNLKQYTVAPALLQKDFSSTTDPIVKREIAKKIATAYRSKNDYKNAETWYIKLADIGQSDALYDAAKMQQSQERYDDAIKTFTQYSKMDAVSKNIARGEIRNCELAKKWIAENTKIAVQNITEINSTAADFSPFLIHSNLYFSSAQSTAKGDITNVWTGEKNADIFKTKKQSEKWEKPTPLDSAINTADFEGTCAFSADGNQLFFTRCGTVDLSTKQAIKSATNQYCHIFYSRKLGANWVEPEKLKLFHDTINVGHPSISADGKMLLVASDAPNGFGGKDLYYFLKTDTGWSPPYNLGTHINTKGDEVFPWLDEKGVLYYASNGLPGMGGLDVFRAPKDKKSWKEPTNLEAPINSGADDFGYIIEKYKPTSINDEILKAGYFTSNRAGGKGSDDIYSFSERWVNYFVLKGLVQEKNYLQPDNPDSELKGMKPIDKVMLIVKSNIDSMTLVSNTAGVFSSPLKAETEYKLTAYKSGYFSNTATFSTKGKRNQDSTYIYISTVIELNRIFPQKEIVIPNIYYDYNKATLREESKLVLDSILIFFSDNKDLAIEIGSHTDSRGSDVYNEKLSQARAQSVVDYLIMKGVAESRLTAKGYGETKLTNQCANGVECTEEEHQKNRRTTFRILGSNKVIESTTPDEIKVVPKE